MSRKINIILVGRNTTEIITIFKEMIIEKGGHILNIVSNFKEADVEIDITEFNGTSNFEIEVNRILNSAWVYKKGLRRTKKIIKKRNQKINWLINKFKKIKDAIKTKAK